MLQLSHSLYMLIYEDSKIAMVYFYNYVVDLKLICTYTLMTLYIVHSQQQCKNYLVFLFILPMPFNIETLSAYTIRILLL